MLCNNHDVCFYLTYASYDLIISLLGLNFLHQETGGIIDHTGYYVTSKFYIKLILDAFLDHYHKEEYYRKPKSAFAINFKKRNVKKDGANVISFKNATTGGIFFFNLFETTLLPNFEIDHQYVLISKGLDAEVETGI